MALSPKEIIEFVYQQFQNKNEEDVIRFAIMQGGTKYPKSNVDNDPFLTATIKLLSERQ